MAAARGIDETVSSGGESKTEDTGAAPPSEPAKAAADGEPSLGKTLTAARERRGVSRAEVVAQTRIPAHYLQMIESSDYGLISDQLYLLPFLRRYAAFLGLDGEEIAMRFVREVQRAEVAAPARMSEPLELPDRRAPRWGRAVAVLVVLAIIVVLYFIASDHHRADFAARPPAPSAASGVPGATLPPPMAAAPAAPRQAEVPSLAAVPRTGTVAPPAAASAAAPGAAPAGATAPARTMPSAPAAVPPANSDTRE